MESTDSKQLTLELEALKLENTRLKKQLANENSMVQAFLENSPATAFIKDSKGRLLYLNKILIESFGFKERNWYGKTEFEIWPEPIARQLRDNDLRILASGVAEDVEEDIGPEDDDSHWMTNKFRFSDNEGNYYIGGMGIDLTRQTKAAEAMLEVIARAEAASVEKSEFLSLMSHELRTPLHSILASAEQWDDAEDEEARKELFNYISLGATRLRSQVDNIVLLAETDGGGLAAGEFEFETRALVERIASYTKGLVGEEVNFLLDYDPALPVLCRADPYLIEHMVRAVLENACKYTEHGEVMLFVHWDKQRQHIIFRVEDSGCGMTEKQQRRIYSDVVQLSRGLNRESVGIGLGLTLCCRLSALLQADLIMDSLIGVGTKVEMSVPVEALPGQVACTNGQDTYQGSILIVEDNPVNAKVLERMLSKLGYQVDTVASGDAALKRLNEQVYKLIFMDIQMPIMDGITATRWIRRRGINTPVVAISSNSEMDVRRRCMEHGVNDFLVKPARRSDVFRVLERQIPAK